MGRIFIVMGYMVENGLSVNPYRPLYPRKLFPDFFQILQFCGVTQGIFRKLLPGKFHEYLPMKKYVFPKTGHDSEAFPETFSNIWNLRIYEISNFI